jgi:hypothetical protein
MWHFVSERWSHQLLPRFVPALKQPLPHLRRHRSRVLPRGRRVTTVFLGARLDCAAALLGLDSYRAWTTPDDSGRCAITAGGSAGEAQAAVVAALHERFVGDWSFEAILMAAPAVKPCAWCKTRGRYAH